MRIPMDTCPKTAPPASRASASTFASTFLIIVSPASSDEFPTKIVDAKTRKAGPVSRPASSVSMVQGLLCVARPLLAVALASQGFFGALLLARFQIERVPLDFLDNVFLLHFALETAQ